MSVFDYEKNVISYIDQVRASILSRPLNLGGVSGSGGGGGGPTGGFVGMLPQTRVAFDASELESNATPLSGMSLLDNLNHIRYRLGVLEDGGVISTAGISIYNNGTIVGSGITILDFLNGVISLVEPGRITITLPSGTTTISGGLGEAGVYNELVTGTSHFDTAQAFSSGTLRVYYNGLRQSPSSYIVDPDLHGFTTDFAIEPGDILVVDYATSTTGGNTSTSDSMTWTPTEGFLGNTVATNYAGTNAVRQAARLSLYVPMKISKVQWNIRTPGTYELGFVSTPRAATYDTYSKVLVSNQEVAASGIVEFTIDPPYVVFPGMHFLQLKNTTGNGVVNTIAGVMATTAFEQDVHYIDYNIMSTQVAPVAISGYIGVYNG